MNFGYDYDYEEKALRSYEGVFCLLRTCKSRPLLGIRRTWYSLVTANGWGSLMQGGRDDVVRGVSWAEINEYSDNS